MGRSSKDRNHCHHQDHQSGSIWPAFLVGIALGVLVPASILVPLLPSLQQYYLTTSSKSAINIPNRQIRSVEDVPSTSHVPRHTIIDTTSEPPDELSKAESEVLLTSGGKLEDYVTFYSKMEDSNTMGTPVTSDDNAKATPEVKEILYTAILTSETRVHDMSSAIQMTWGSELKDHQFFYGITPGFPRVERSAIKNQHIKLAGIESDDPYGFEHIRQTLVYMCRNIHKKYNWYTVVRDSTYVNTHALMGVLRKMSPSQPLIIGTPMAEVENRSQLTQCSVEHGLIFSDAAMRQVCLHIERCPPPVRASTPAWERGEGSPGIQQLLEMQRQLMTQAAEKLASCFHYTSGVPCLDSKRLTDRFHLVLDSAADIYTASPSLLTSFVGPLRDVPGLYQVHMKIMRLRMTEARQELQRLSGELSSDPTSVRPKRDSEEESNRESSSLVQALLANGTAETFSNLIDDKGQMFLDSCQVSPISVHGREALGEAVEVAKDAIDGDVRDMEELSFRMDKANMGTEYHLFYVETQPQPPKKRGNAPVPPKIHQTVVVQTYGELNVDKKEAKPPQQIQIILTYSSGRPDDLRLFLRRTEVVCSDLPDLSEGCAVWILCPNNQTESLSNQLSTYLQEEHNLSIHILKLTCTDCGLEDYQQRLSQEFVDEDTIVAFLSVAHIFSQDFLLRCMLNVKHGQRVYFPIAFQKYDTSTGLVPVSEDTGFWNGLSYDAMCACVGDLTYLHGSLTGSSSLHSLHDYFRESEFQVYRVPDPEFQIGWKNEWCSRSMDDCKQSVRFNGWNLN